jgi:hypothetical protein
MPGLVNTGGSQQGTLYVPAAGGLTVGIATGATGDVLTSVLPNTPPQWLPPAALVPPFATVVLSQSLSVNTAYSAQSATPITLTLPTAPTLGSTIWVGSDGVGGFILQLPAGETLVSPGVSTSVAGTLTSQAQYQEVAVQYFLANTWKILYITGGSMVAA